MISKLKKTTVLHLKVNRWNSDVNIFRQNFKNNYEIMQQQYDYLIQNGN